MVDAVQLKAKFDGIWPHLDERAKRLMAASEARQLGYGGVSEVSRACGLSRVTITKALAELDSAPPSMQGEYGGVAVADGPLSNSIRDSPRRD
jgi:hypothetical protein